MDPLSYNSAGGYIKRLGGSLAKIKENNPFGLSTTKLFRNIVAETI